MHFRRSIAAGILTAALLAPSVAAAACAQSDLGGRWRFHYWDTMNEHWFHCRLDIASGGDVSATARCRAHNGDLYTIVAAGSTLTMVQSGVCRLTGTLKYTLPNDDEITLNLVSATMTRDHGTANGFASQNSRAIFYLTKY
jgi:hypothetical protein